MLRSKGLTEKLLLLGVDGMDPRFTKRLLNEGKLPNVKKLIERGACREDLMMLGANPTITPPMWATLATGAYPMTHGIMDYCISGEEDKDITLGAFSSAFLKAEPIFNVTANAGKKTLCMHWPGGSFPPTVDNNIYTIDGSSPGACCAWANQRDKDTVFIASTKAEKVSYRPMSVFTSDLEGDEVLKYTWHTTTASGVTPEAKERIEKYLEWYKNQINVEGYTIDYTYVVDSVYYPEGKGIQWNLADFPIGGSISPVYPANGWEFEIPDEVVQNLTQEGFLE